MGAQSVGPVLRGESPEALLRHYRRFPDAYGCAKMDLGGGSEDGHRWPSG